MTDLPGADWLTPLLSSAAAVLRQQNVYWREMHAGVSRHQQRLVELVGHAEDAAVKRERLDADQLSERVMATLRREEFSSLTRRELRVAARLFRSLSPDQILRFVEERPDAIPMLVDEYFERWTSHAEAAAKPGTREGDVLARLLQTLRSAPNGVRMLHRGIPSDALLSATAPQEVLQRLPSALSELLVALERQLGCRPHWEVFREVVVAWGVRALGARGLDDVWRELMLNAFHAEPILPLVESPSGALAPDDPWFPKSSRRSAAVAATTVQVRVVAALLRPCTAGTPLAARIVSRLVRSSFRDPRIPPLSSQWEAVRRVAPEPFAQFLAGLVKDDLGLFFRYAMDETDREQFWLRYLKAIDGTLAVLSKNRYRELSERFSGKDERRALLDRARRASKAGVSAFCLFFSRVVVVEFSERGNAAYLYGRDQFESVILPRLDSSPDVTSVLKRTDIDYERILHQADWEERAEKLLRRYGIRPDGVN